MPPPGATDARAIGATALPFAVDDDAAAAKRGRRVRVHGVAGLVVVDHGPGGTIPDPEAEPVDATAAGRLSVRDREHEAVVARTADRARALVLPLRSGDD